MTRTDTQTQTYIAELEARREERDEVGDARESTELSYRIRMLREGTPLDIDVRALALGDRRIPIRPATAERELIAERIEAGELVSDKSMSDSDFLAPLLDESPAEELGRLRRELSELDRETPEFAEVLDRIAVLVREQAVAYGSAEHRRRIDAGSDALVAKAENDARVEQLREVIREAELELEAIERPDIAELREELNGLETGIALARSEEELKALGRLAYSARDRVYGTPGIPRDIPQRVDDLLARARTQLMTFDGGRA